MDNNNTAIKSKANRLAGAAKEQCNQHITKASKVQDEQTYIQRAQRRGEIDWVHARQRMKEADG
jgi:hypothetical protein